MSTAIITLITCAVIKKLAQVVYNDCKPAVWAGIVTAVVLGGVLLATLLDKIMLIPFLLRF